MIGAKSEVGAIMGAPSPVSVQVQVLDASMLCITLPAYLPGIPSWNTMYGVQTPRHHMTGVEGFALIAWRDRSPGCHAPGLPLLVP